MPLSHEALTRAILEAVIEVSNELGVGFVESVYEHALFVALRDRGIRAERQVALKVFFRGELAGAFHADLVVEDEIILELKAVKALLPEHQAQILNYLKASGTPLGLLINFGQARAHWMRFENRFQKNDGNKDERDERDES